MKTKNAFALRDFDDKRIWKQKFFTPRYFGLPEDNNDSDIFEEFISLWEEENLIGVSPTDEEILDIYCRQAIKALNKEWHGRFKLMIEILNNISRNVLFYLEKINRHYKRLEEYSLIWNEKVSSGVTPSEKDIRMKTCRIQKLLKSYAGIQKTIKNLQSSIKQRVKNMTDTYEKADRYIFAIRLRQARSEAGLTQVQIADKIGMTQGGYTNYENAVREPSIATLKRLSKILKRPTDWLLGLTPQ
ncbi:MAG: helix-turn-helix domain-containing protein [Selenomonadaceae bacterium]|nr:helix-turn-helix domain-containing protein [Selenomonadaceae bacterium]